MGSASSVRIFVASSGNEFMLMLDVGGYATELIEHRWFGWEDYDLWLTLDSKVKIGGRTTGMLPRRRAGVDDRVAPALYHAR